MGCSCCHTTQPNHLQCNIAVMALLLLQPPLPFPSEVACMSRLNYFPIAALYSLSTWLQCSSYVVSVQERLEPPSRMWWLRCAMVLFISVVPAWWWGLRMDSLCRKTTAIACSSLLVAFWLLWNTFVSAALGLKGKNINCYFSQWLIHLAEGEFVADSNSVVI